MLKTASTIFYTVLSKGFPSAVLFLLLKNYGLDKNIISFVLPAAVLIVPILNFGLDFQLTMNGSKNEVKRNNEIMFFLAVFSSLLLLLFFPLIGTRMAFFVLLTIILQHSQFYASHLLGTGNYLWLVLVTILWRVLIVGLLFLRAPLNNVTLLLTVLVLFSLSRSFYAVNIHLASIIKRVIDILRDNMNFLLNAFLAAGVFILPRFFSALQGESSYEDNILISSYGLSNLLWISFIRRYISQLLNVDFNFGLSSDTNEIVQRMLYLIPVFYIVSGSFVILYCYLFDVDLVTVKMELNLIGLMIALYSYYAILNDRLAKEFKGSIQLGANIVGFCISLMFVGIRLVGFELSDFIVYFFSVSGTIGYVLIGIRRVNYRWSFSLFLRPLIYISAVQVVLNVVFSLYE